MLFDQKDLLLGPIVSMSLPASSFNSNMIGLQYFLPTVLFPNYVSKYNSKRFFIRNEKHLIQNGKTFDLKRKKFDKKPFNYCEFSPLSRIKNKFRQVNT